MKTALRTATLLATLPLLASPALAAINDWDYDTSEEDNEVFAPQTSSKSYDSYTPNAYRNRRQTENSDYAEASTGTIISVESFFGLDCCDYDDYVIYGATARYTLYSPTVSLPDTNISPELFVSGRLGCGWGDGEGPGYDDFLLIGTICIGGDIQLRFNNIVSAFVRAEIGFGFAYAEIETARYGDGDDTDFGLAYSVGVGLQFDIIPGRQFIVCGIDYIGLTAQPNITLSGNHDISGKIDEPAFVLFSVGYKWSF